MTTLDDLGDGSLEPGDQIEGLIRFESGAADGYHYVALELPDADARPVWRIERV